MIQLSKILIQDTFKLSKMLIQDTFKLSKMLIRHILIRIKC